MQEELLSRKQTKEESVLLTFASLSVGFPALLKHIIRGDACLNHGKIHSAAWMYAGCSSDKDFVKKCEINCQAKIAPDVQGFITYVQCFIVMLHSNVH